MHQLVKDTMTVGFLASFAALVFYAKAHAQEVHGTPLPDGTIVTIGEPMISCDTSDMIEQIAKAKLESDEAAQTKYEEFHAVINAYNQPSCVFGRLQMSVTLIHSAALPNLTFGGTVVSAWNIHIGAQQSDWFALYVVPNPPKSGVSL